MSITSFLEAVKSTPVATGIRDSLYIFPFLEAVHVIAITLVFGTIMVVDLRLLGVAWSRRPYQRVSHDMLKLTWICFGLAALTGLFMFIVNARVYFENGFFRAKFALMALAGLNMLLFQFVTSRGSESWDEGVEVPRIAKAAGVASLVLWLAVIGMGRAVGFSTTGAAAKEHAPPANVDFNQFLGPDASSGPPPS